MLRRNKSLSSSSSKEDASPASSGSNGKRASKKAEKDKKGKDKKGLKKLKSRIALSQNASLSISSPEINSHRSNSLPEPTPASASRPLSGMVSPRGERRANAPDSGGASSSSSSSRPMVIVERPSSEEARATSSQSSSASSSSSTPSVLHTDPPSATSSSTRDAGRQQQTLAPASSASYSSPSKPKRDAPPSSGQVNGGFSPRMHPPPSRAPSSLSSAAKNPSPRATMSSSSSSSSSSPSSSSSQSSASSMPFVHPYFEPSRYQYHQVSGWAHAGASPDDDPDVTPKRSGIVKLNIGGVKYETTVGTLVSRGDNFFTTLFSNKFATLKDEEGYYFIDRDGEYFKPLLSFLRTGELRVPPGMSKVCIEREAHFYLIDLNEGAPPLLPALYHPSPLGSALSPNPRFYLRYDGVYLQKTRDEEDFFAYYRFFRDGKVSIVTTSRHKLQNKVNNTYEVIDGEWLLIRSNFHRKPTIFMGTFGYNCIQIHWRSPRDRKHLDSNTLHFFPSFEPPTDLVFSNQHCRTGNKQYHRLNFKDGNQVTITVMEKDRQQHRLTNSIKRTATYAMEKEEVVTLSINDDFFPEPIISLGTILLERRQERQVVGQKETCRVYLAVDKHEDEDDDEIDIYTFLRTSSPPVSLNDDDTASSDDDDYRDPYAAATLTNNAPAAAAGGHARNAAQTNARTRSERSLSQ